jgi:hypothetical protein
MATLGLSGCFIESDDDLDARGCIRAQGDVISEEFNLNRIDAIDLKISGRVYLRQGNEQRVRVEGPSAAVDYLNRRVRGGLWEIEFERCLRNVDDLRIYITIPDLTRVKISGSGKVVGENLFTVDDVDLVISGSGDITLNLDADDIFAEITGSGNINLSGVADEVVLRLSGSGNLRAFDLKARKGQVNITGSGDVEVDIAEDLIVIITGSGNVYYHGTPRLDVKINGSGRVINAN